MEKGKHEDTTSGLRILSRKKHRGDENPHIEKNLHQDAKQKTLIARESLEDIEPRPTNEIMSFPCHGLERMPDELWLQIFRYLSPTMLTTTARVSKNWRRLSYDPTFWKKVCLDWKNTVGSGTLGYVLSRGCRSLKLNTCTFELPVFDDEWPLADSYALQEIYLESSQTRNTRNRDNTMKTAFLEILTRCRQLERIDTFGIFFDDDMARTIAENNPLVRQLRSCGRGLGLTYDGLHAIVKGCQRLESLVLEPTYVRHGTATLTGDQLSSLVNELPSSIKKLAIFNKCDELTDQHVQRLVAKCPELTFLVFLDCTRLTATTVESVARLAKLIVLSLNGCKKIPFHALRGLAECPNLRTLIVRDVITAHQGKILQRDFKPLGSSGIEMSSLARQDGLLEPNILRDIYTSNDRQSE